MSKKNTFYVTTPIYYVNAKPHIGSLYSTLLADVISKIMKLYGKKTFFLTGTDEHGQKVYDAAQLNNQDPQTFVDSLIPAFKEAWKSWNIEYDIFMRTTNEDHKKAVQEWIRNLQKKQLIYKASYEGWYSSSSESFLTEKDIECRDEQGTPLCPISKKPAEWITQEAYFFKLSLFENDLINFYEKNPHFITPKERLAEIVSFVKGGLKDLCISRSKKSLSWGIPFPDDEDHVVYVWADALNNYITALGYLSSKENSLFNSTWPCDVHIMAKDIVRFHAVYWPAFLMASEIQLPLKLLVHGWILVDGNKMSKSLGNVIDPNYLIQQYGVDACRYYFIRHLAITHDATFSYEDLEEKINGELCDVLGNLVQRVIVLAQKNKCSIVEKRITFDTMSQQLYEQSIHMLKQFEHEMNDYMIHRAYGHVWNFINQINAYMQHAQPWKISLEHNKSYFEMVISTVLHSIKTVAYIINPIMESTSNKILELIGVEKNNSIFKDLYNEWNDTFNLAIIPTPLFKKIEKKKEIPMEPKKIDNTQDVTIQEIKNEYIQLEDFKKVIMRVGYIKSVDRIAKSDKLYHLMVDFGEFGIKSVCSGIAQEVLVDDILHKKALFVSNLEPRKLCGYLSEAMILTYKNTHEKICVITVSDNALLGSMAS
jgi:methionyl-tRNA synthetase